MERKKKPNGLLISGLISALASLAIVAIAPGFAAGPSEKANDQARESSSKSSDTKGNDRKSGYEDNSSTPQETNHGKGADNDGDAGNEPRAYTEDDDTNDGGTKNNVSDSGDNKHPSGKDRSVESGKSGNQGRSESNPDDSKGPMRYEGVQGDDKPNGPGGTDLADQDGNNGCGNDDDFDDDNNGWCGKPDRTKPADVSKPRVCPDGSEMPATGRCEEVGGEIIERCPDGTAMPASGNIEDCEVELGENPSEPGDDVLGDQIERDENPAQPDVDVAADAEVPSVLGIRLSPALNEPVKVAGAVLPFTGGDMLLFLVLALALFGSGLVIMKATKIGSRRG